ncbi:MAG: CoA ester lyase [Jannaschia sp.]
MPSPDLPLRSVLYIPASKARALDKARSLPVDAIIFDLEDAVAPDEKDSARATLLSELERGGYGRRHRILRVNGAQTGWGADDLAAAAGADIDAILLPKVNGPEDVVDAARVLDRAGSRAALWAMMETPAGILNAAGIAAAPRMTALVLGTNDLARDIGCRDRADRAPLMHALQTCVLAARAAGIACLDGVYNAFRDQDGLRAECAQGRDLGMDGKTLIHPTQVAIANEAFAPTAEEADLARRQITAFDAAIAEGKGIAVLDGRIVENLHVDTARRTLAKLDGIAERDG